MRPHWKDLAQRAAKSAFAPKEVCEALPYALKRDILEAPIKQIRDIMVGGSLFPELRIEQLEATQRQHARTQQQHTSVLVSVVQDIQKLKHPPMTRAIGFVYPKPKKK